MLCRKLEEELVEYVDGGLGADRRRYVEAHLEGCEDCRLAVERLELSRLALASLEPLSMPEVASSRVLSGIRRELSSVREGFFSRLRSSRALTVAGAATAVLVAFAVVMGLYLSYRPDEKAAVVEEEGRSLQEEGLPVSGISTPGADESWPPLSKVLDEASGFASIAPTPVVKASDTDYSPESLKQMVENEEVTQSYEANYTMSDAICLGVEFTRQIADEMSEMGMDAPMVESMISYVTVGEPVLLPCFVEKAFFTGTSAMIIGLAAPPRSGNSTRLSRIEVWVMDPAIFEVDPDGSILHFLEHK